MREKILLVEPLLDPVEAELEAAYEIVRPGDLEAGDLAGIRAIVSGAGTGISREWVERLPDLGLIAINGVGTDKVDLGHAAARGIHVSTTPDVLTDDVADTAIALILAALRRLGEGERLVRSGQWAQGAKLPLGRGLSGKTLAIVGLGQIGAAIGKRAEAFGMEIGFWNRSAKTVEGWTRHESVIEAARWADVLAVAVAATPQTEAIIDAGVLEALGAEGFIVNVARGAVIDEAALLSALENKAIAGAGLDVFLNEPLIDTRFHALDNAFLFPHQGSATIETRTAMARLVLDNLSAFFAGEAPPTSVTAGRF